jgi:hypothetical protein
MRLYSYASFHIQETEYAAEVAAENNNKPPTVPSWVLSGGLTAADWAVITEYIEVLKPLKSATDRLKVAAKLAVMARCMRLYLYLSLLLLT